MIRVAGYCRVSTDKEDQVNSFEAQQRFFREYIARNPDWELYEIYADEGITGTNTKKRTQFNRMIRDAYTGCFQYIFTKEISRFSRNILDTISFSRQLKAIGVGIFFLTENINTMDPESELLLTIMGTMAQEESRRTSVRVKWGQTRQMERGIVFGPSLLGYQVNAGKLLINPEEAELVRLIFLKYGCEKKGASVIARELQQAGYITHKGNQTWCAGQIIRILKNEKYVGDLVQKKSITPDYLSHRRILNHGEEEKIVIRNHHEPIISRELWEIVQEELRKRNKHRKCTSHSSRYLFSGKIKCGICGKNFVCRYKYQNNGERIRRWSCYNACVNGKSVCKIGILVRDDDAKKMLNIVLKNLKINKSEIISDIITLIFTGNNSRQMNITQTSYALNHMIDNIRRKKKVMLDGYFSGEITREEMLEVKSDYDFQIQKLTERTKELESCKMTNKNAIARFLEDLLSGKTENESLYKNILGSLTVNEDGEIIIKLSNLSHIYHFTI